MIEQEVSLETVRRMVNQFIEEGRLPSSLSLETDRVGWALRDGATEIVIEIVGMNPQDVARGAECNVVYERRPGLIKITVFPPITYGLSAPGH